MSNPNNTPDPISDRRQAACDFAREHGLELEANPQNGTRVEGDPARAV